MKTIAFTHFTGSVFRGAGSFTSKVLITLCLVAVGDQVFGNGTLGAATAVFAAFWLIAVWLTRPTARSKFGSMVALAFAWALIPLFVEDPSPLAAALFWCALALAALLPRAVFFDDAWRWALRLTSHLFGQIVEPVFDAVRLNKTRSRWRRSIELGKAAAVLALPLIGAAVFVGLFVSANPILAEWIKGWGSDWSLPRLPMARALLWLLLAIPVWGTFRPGRFIKFPPSSSKAPPFRALPGVSQASVTISLVLFNAIFAVENLLDVVFLWSGAELPDGVTLAEYAHRGAYPLIATALLAGAFVLIVLRPGSPLAANRLLRRLVYFWIAQNVLLVASSGLRTLDYIEAYSLTRLRLAALIWMALVTVGLALICWRIFKNKSGAWLINANAAALVATLSACAIVDLGSVTATWNVRHNALTGSESMLDVAYLEYLGPSALDAMIEFERSHAETSFAPVVAAARLRVAGRLALDQSDWRSWTFRGARRLAAVRAAEPAWVPSAPEGE